MIATKDNLDRIYDAIGSGQVVFLKVTSPTGYPFVCWVFPDPTPHSSRIQSLYTEQGSDFSLTNTHSWPQWSHFAAWLSKRDVKWLEPEELSDLLRQSPPL